ncbi:MAG TPA: adenylate/guanylate cyclase domain-containing protein [Methylomirabilota bacterium]|nr:adenylate/guanylate cyclase domain-containing protein [Methylomirabilota bacterium]
MTVRPVAAGTTVSPQSYTPRYLAEKILTSRHALEGERKQVTVLFADVKGSLELLSDRDPEEARKLLDPVLERMMEAVHRYEGTVNQVMGDGIMALFGAPLAHEDHAVRACYAALAMQQAIRRYTAEVRRDHGIEVQVRVGLNSGEVVVRAIGSDLRMDYSAVGQTTHLAARMEQLATPGSTRLTGETLRLAEGFVQVVPIGPVPVKGLPGPVDVYELSGPSATRTRLQAAAARGLSRFVGRGRELDHLRQTLDKARGGQGQIVAVVGEPGVGKSRLLWEFIHSHRTQDWLVLESSSVSYGKASAYLPVIDLCKSYFRIDTQDDRRSVREKVTGKLLTLDESFRAMVPAFLSLLEEVGDDAAWEALDPGQRRRRTVDGLRRMLLRESQIRPLCIVFEDLHWVDAETQGLLDALVESLPTARILLLVNYRPEYGHGWGSKTSYSQLRLDPLPPESAEELLHALLGEDDDLEPLKRLLVERTEGVPFFLEESVRTLVEIGALAGERGSYRLGRPFDTIQVPATVQAILAARIDRLPPEDKTLLQTAAVIGKDVPFALLHAISETPEETLRHGLARLRAAEFLYETALFPELEYTFKHALTQEVAYSGLLQDRRRELHARIVRVFESLYPGRAGEQTSWLTLHAFRGEVWDRAVAYLGGNDLPSLDGYLSGFTGRDNPGSAWWMGDHEHAVRAAQRELGAFPAIAGWNISLGIATNLRLGQAHHSLGQYSRAVELLRKNIEFLGGDLLYEHCNMAGLPSVFSRAWLALCLAERGEFAEAAELGEEALGIAATGDPGYSFTLGCAGLGNVYVARGDFGRAIAILERGLARELDELSTRVWPFVGSALGAAYTHAGRLAEALPLLEEAVERAATVNLKANQSLRLARLAEGHLGAGRPESALPLAAQALDLAQEHRERGHEAHAFRLLASIEVEREIPALDRAEEGYRKALAIAEQLGMRPLQAHCYHGLGRLHRRRGDAGSAAAAIAAARDLFQAMDMTFWLHGTE